MVALARPRLNGMDEPDLRKLALAIVNHEVFGTWCIPEDKMRDCLAHVFMPVAYLSLQSFPDNVGHLYEYTAAAIGTTVHGYPKFVSMRLMTDEDADHLHPLVQELVAKREQFHKDMMEFLNRA
jgi:hypothetical protein